MSSFLVATLATPAQPTPFGTVPSTKNLWTARPVKFWIAIRAYYTYSRYTLSRYLATVSSAAGEVFPDCRALNTWALGLSPAIVEPQPAVWALADDIFVEALDGGGVGFGVAHHRQGARDPGAVFANALPPI